MASKAPNKNSTRLKARRNNGEKVFGSRNVHKHEGSLVGKKQDKAGRWRLAKMPYYLAIPSMRIR